MRLCIIIPSVISNVSLLNFYKEHVKATGILRWLCDQLGNKNREEKFEPWNFKNYIFDDNIYYCELLKNIKPAYQLKRES